MNGRGGIHIKRDEIRAYEWVMCNDTGVSSATIWAVMMGRHVARYQNWTGSEPRDAGDFGRCASLL